jgi:hypothetical protein
MVPTARLESFPRFRFAPHRCDLNWDIQHVDIKTAFLHGVLLESESVHGTTSRFRGAWKRELGHAADEEHLTYGMKHAPAASRIWNQTFH